MMEKSVTPTIMGKVSKHIPDDVLFSILSKLSLKSLKRFESVCKSWSLLFENPYFMRIYQDHIIHRNHSDHDDASIILRRIVQAPRELLISLYLVYGNNFENKVKLDTSLPSQELGQKIIIVGSVSINGILCLTSMVVEDRKVVLWNPATDELKVIPPSPVESVTPFRVFLPQIHGFGYDGVRDDYKVLRYVQFGQISVLDTLARGLSDEHVAWNEISYEPLWEIYSLRSNLWRKLDIKMPTLMVSFADVEIVRFYMDGMCHWWTQTSWSDDIDEASESYLVSFDVSNEVFFTTPMPDDSFDLGLVESHLVMLNGYIALISYYGETATFYISILGEIGVKESWTKLFIVGSLSTVERPIGAGKKGNILFLTKDDELVCFDLGTQKIVELGFEGDMCQMG
ncbi:putative F-box protein At3g16210 isoform X2 [Trifolium pratense]|uniref:putative F-box protein At3g16210 isoform X2 n=1 Tax=Trifolium pratense TaxID=57577 RepID=UPI001E694823|nr:putative F-box protein At3g16210 isoform X2 [Trifolium pratense]